MKSVNILFVLSPPPLNLSSSQRELSRICVYLIRRAQAALADPLGLGPSSDRLFFCSCLSSIFPTYFLALCAFFRAVRAYRVEGPVSANKAGPWAGPRGRTGEPFSNAATFFSSPGVQQPASAPARHRGAAASFQEPLPGAHTVPHPPCRTTHT